jgi:hypothetical protein
MAVGFPVIRSIASASVEPLCVQGSGTYLWSMEEWNRRVFRDGGLGVLTCKPFFHIVAFLFVGLKRALLLTGYGTSSVHWGPQFPPSWGFLVFGIKGMSTIFHLA